jgi:hypothetical protein
MNQDSRSCSISSVFFPDAGDEDKKEERLDDLDEDELDNVSFTCISYYILYFVQYLKSQMNIAERPYINLVSLVYFD